MKRWGAWCVVRGAFWETMTYNDWLKTVPIEITADTLYSIAIENNPS